MKEKINFEKSLKELENIVHKLENEELPLEDALKAFEKGVHLSRECAACLDAAEKRIEELTEDEKGELHLKDWEVDENK